MYRMAKFHRKRNMRRAGGGFRRKGRTFGRKRYQNKRVGRWQAPYQKINGVGLPRAIKVRLPFVYSSSFTNTDFNLASSETFTVNSLYDPRYAFSGEQPLWSDQLASCGYINYRVLGCKYKIRCTNMSNLPVYVGTSIQPRDAFVPGSQAQFILNQDQPNYNIKVVGANNSGRDTMYFKGYIDIAKWLGMRKQAVMDSSDFIGQIEASNPNRMMDLTFYTAALNVRDPTTSIQMEYTITLTYYAVLFQSTNFIQPSTLPEPAGPPDQGDGSTTVGLPGTFE